jgi:quinolinate synthase
MGEGADCESCAHCEWMAMNTLDNCLDVIKTKKNEILIDLTVAKKAKESIQKLLDFTA